MNKYLVSAGKNEIVILNPPRRMSRKDAIEFAAWLFVVAMATPSEREAVIREVEES